MSASETPGAGSGEAKDVPARPGLPVIAAVARCDRVARRAGLGGRIAPQRLFTWDEVHAMRPLRLTGLHVVVDSRYSGKLADDEKQASARLQRWAPLIDVVLADGQGHVVLAGGAAAMACSDYADNGEPSDFDFFFWGVGPARASALLRQILDRFGAGACVLRSAHAVTVLHNHVRYQFVLRLYPSADQVLAGFDLQACMALYSPALAFRFTLAGAVAARHRFCVLEPSRRSPNYESRLAKYTCRDYAVVVPFAGRPSWDAGAGVRLASEGRRVWCPTHYSAGCPCVLLGQARLYGCLGPPHRLPTFEDCTWYEWGSYLTEVDQDYGHRPQQGHRSAQSRLENNLWALLRGRGDLVLASSDSPDLFPDLFMAYGVAALLRRRHTWTRWFNDGALRSRFGAARGAVLERLQAMCCDEYAGRRAAALQALATQRPDLMAEAEEACARQRDKAAQVVEGFLVSPRGDAIRGGFVWAVANPGGQGRMLTGSVEPGRQALPLADLYGAQPGLDFPVGFHATAAAFARVWCPALDGRVVPAAVVMLVEDWLCHFSVSGTRALLGLPC